MIRATTILLSLLVAVGCSAGGGGSGTYGRSSETPEEPRELQVERISSGAPGQGPERPRVILAPSADVLSEEIGAKVPGSGAGTYLVAYWGQKPTGGYSLAVESARLEENTVTVALALKEPSPDAMVTQALTYPYVLAVVRGLDPEGKRFSFVNGEGQKLNWLVRRTGG